MKILLCCKAGVTSNMFASALKDEASKKIWKLSFGQLQKQ